MKQNDIPSLVEELYGLLARGWYEPGDYSVLAVKADAWIKRVREIGPIALDALSQPKEDAVGGGVPAGMVPYGTDHPDYPNQPSDWDAGAVAFRYGGQSNKPSTYGWRWQHEFAGGSDEAEDVRQCDIIAYTPKAASSYDGAAAMREACATLVDSRVRFRRSYAYGNEVRNPEVAEIAAAIRAMRLPEPPTSDASERLREAATKARDQFAFYAREHMAAGKIMKANTNSAFADLLTAALFNNEVPYAK